jgi:hypothetical protein
LPADLAIDPGTGVISGTLGFGSAGIYNVTVTVSDGVLSDDDTFTLTVSATNQPPAFSTDITDQSNVEGDSVSLDADATDADLDVLIYSATGLPDGVSIDAGSGVISGTLSFASAGIHSVTITVSDGLDTDTDTFSWTVANANQPPVFSTDITDQSNAEGDSVNLDADASDPDLDGLTYSASGLPDGVSIDAGSGVISGTLSFASAGIHSVTITVSDGADTDTDTFTWTVANTNRAPIFSTDIVDQGDAEGDVVSLDADATDADLDTLIYSASNLPDGISINPSTGVISGTLSSSSAGTYNVTITVGDGTDTDTDTFTWTVADANQAPVFVTDIGNQANAEGNVVNLDADATDGDLDTLTYSASNLPDGVTINPSSGVISGTLSFVSAGTHSVTITVSDGIDTDTDTFTWAVTNTNRAPEFSTDIANQSNVEGANVNLDADATDPDGTTLTYSATGLPDGIGINSSTGVISGTLSFVSAGAHNVTITVSDGALTDTDTFTWTVANTNRAPVFSTEFGDRTDAEGASVNLDANATDPDAGTTLTYSATGLPGGVSINSTNGVISGTLAVGSAGDHNVTITVSDGALTDVDTFTWTVTPPTLVVYVDDTFTRTTATGWGTATPTGGAYSLSGGTANFSVGGGLGVITHSASGSLRSALLNTPSAADVDISFSVAANKVAAGSHQFVYALARRNGSNEYRVKLRLDTNGNVYVGASTVISNSETNVGNMVLVPGLTQAPNAIIRFRAQVTGTGPTTLRVRAWADGSAEPSTWTYSQTNSNASLQGAGGLGLRTYIGGATSNTPVVFSFDNYRVTSIAP